CCLLSRAADHLDLHSFPTRRSSDLQRAAAARCGRSPRTALPPTPPSSRTGLPRPLDSRSARLLEQGRDHRLELGRDHGGVAQGRSEEHTSELQSRENLVCRLLLEKK